MFPQTCNNNDTDVIECLINLPSLHELPNSLIIINIQNHQLNDPWLLQTQQLDPLQYLIKTINNHNIICFRKIFNQPDQHRKICIPPALIQPAIRWYYLVLGHPGSQHLQDTIRLRFYNPGLYVLCHQYQCPDNCIMYKNNGRPNGHLVLKQALLAPWMECAVDLIGPWKITIHGRPIVFKALTAFDPVTNLLEIIWINDK